MITAILGTGIIAVLSTVFVKRMNDTMRGLVCWTFSMLALLAALIVYYSGASAFSADLGAVGSALIGAGAVVVLVLLIELFAPAARFRSARLRDYDRSSAEETLNIVMAICTFAAVTAACCTEYFGSPQFCAFGIIPALAISLRQFSYFIYRTKQDTLTADKDENRRMKLLRSLSSGKRSL